MHHPFEKQSRPCARRSHLHRLPQTRAHAPRTRRRPHRPRHARRRPHHAKRRGHHPAQTHLRVAAIGRRENGRHRERRRHVAGQTTRNHPRCQLHQHGRHDRQARHSGHALQSHPLDEQRCAPRKPELGCRPRARSGLHRLEHGRSREGRRVHPLRFRRHGRCGAPQRRARPTTARVST